MEAGKAMDAYGCMAGHFVEQADAEQAYVQAYLDGEETWIHSCDEFQNHRDYWSTFHHPDGTRRYNRPCVKIIKHFMGTQMPDRAGKGTATSG